MDLPKVRELLDKQDALRTDRELVIRKGNYEAARELQDQIDQLNDEIIAVIDGAKI